MYSIPKNPRVRFAPAPTGMMHLGNIRQAVLNALFAQKYRGSFVLRLEDTDPQRLFDPEGKQILADLAWLGLKHDEGPDKGGPYGPYKQSQRHSIYEEHLTKLIVANKVYRCFCTSKELERKRNLQKELKKAPRYDRTCAHIPQEDIIAKLQEKIPFIWRYRVPPITVEVTDLVRGSTIFDLTHFSDIPLTRADGSFTFLFANFVDDYTMKITWVLRGADHGSNSALQRLLYLAFQAVAPHFWHTPIITNHEGHKLSKRDFGFSLDDLRKSGFVPEAIINYLALIGSKTPEQEIMSFEQLAQHIDFQLYSKTNTVRYDEQKLRWFNHAWLKQLPLSVVAARCKPFLAAAYPQAATLNTQTIEQIIQPIKDELHTLTDCIALAHPFFAIEMPSQQILKSYNISTYRQVFHEIAEYAQGEHSPHDLTNYMRELCITHGVPSKNLWCLLRLALTGDSQGTSLTHLLEMLPASLVRTRLKNLALAARL